MCGGSKIAKIAIPALGGILGGPLLAGGALGLGAGGVAAGAGLGTAAGSLATGASPKKALLGGALSGLTSFALGPAGLNVFGGGPGAAPTGVGTPTNVSTGLPSGAAGQAAGAVTSPISPAGAGVFGGEEAFLSGADFLGSDLASVAASGGGSAAAPSVSGDILGSASTPTTDFTGIGGLPAGSPTDWASTAGGLEAPNSPWINPDLGRTMTPGEVTTGPGQVGTAPVAQGGEWNNPDLGRPMTPGEATTGPAAGAAAAGGPNWLDSALSGIGLDPQTSKLGGFISENPGLILGGGGLAASAMMNQPSEYEDELQRLAEFYGQQGTEFSNYLRTGTLPPGAQEQLDQGADSAKAAIRSKHAAMGTSGSSMEVQELSAVDERQKARGFEYAVNLLNSGVQQSGLSSELYNFLLNAESARDQNLQNAIGRFATAAAA